MAIDTQTKRMSVQAYTFGLLRPVATGTIGVAQRAMVAWFYSGFTYAQAAIDEVILARESRRRGRAMLVYGRG